MPNTSDMQMSASSDALQRELRGETQVREAHHIQSCIYLCDGLYTAVCHAFVCPVRQHIPIRHRIRLRPDGHLHRYLLSAMLGPPSVIQLAGAPGVALSIWRRDANAGGDSLWFEATLADVAVSVNASTSTIWVVVKIRIPFLIRHLLF